MRPDKNVHLYEEFAEASVPRLAWEVERTAQADMVLADLSTAMNKNPVKSSVVEPTFLAKLYALSKLTFDTIGVSGLNPLDFIDFRSNLTVDAFACPPHDRYEDPKSGLPIKTRVIMVIPPKHFSSDEGDLEFFGINVYAEKDELPEENTIGPSYNVPLPVPGGLIMPRGNPIQGLTNVFAARHKEHGIVRIYGTSIQVKPMAREIGDVDRTAEDALTIDVPNQLGVTLKELTGDMFSEAVNEFRSALQTLTMSQEVNPEATSLSDLEQAAMKSAYFPKPDEEEPGLDISLANGAKNTDKKA